MAKRVTPAVVNKALVAKYGDKVEMVRGNGYYYFAGELGIRCVPSIMAFTLEGWTMDEILTHVATAIAEENA